MVLSRVADATLEDGLPLTPEAFDRCIQLIDEGVKVELLDGRVHMPPPAGDSHATGQNLLQVWIGTYAILTPGVEARDDALVRLPAGHRVAPDGMLCREGTLQPEPDGFLSGMPGLVAEIAVASAGTDLVRKRRIYEEAGVPEYIVWVVREAKLFWFRLVDGRYEVVEPDEDGVIESTAFPGLRLPVTRLLAGDRRAVLPGG
ncbi:MAG: Uma2 family endonuclease [Dehalococcoidia bacterium]